MDYSDRKGDWIITYTGKRFYPLDPREEDISILDIAHSLSTINRFTGHARFPYSVAQHCIEVSYEIDPQFALAGLLHDATEAYVNDLSRPLKRNLPEYCAVEDKIHAVISARFNVDTRSPAVKLVDTRALVTEAWHLCSGESWYFESPWPEPYSYTVRERTWRDVKQDYLNRFEELV